MALTNGINIALLVNGVLGEEHYDELMAQWRGLDCLVMPVANDILSTPPGSPSNGDTYLIGGSATDAWATHDGKIARWTTALVAPAWEFFTPKKGWQVTVKTGVTGVIYQHTGTAWQRLDGVPTYADQTAAASGGLVAGELFKTSAGALMVKT